MRSLITSAMLVFLLARLVERCMVPGTRHRSRMPPTTLGGIEQVAIDLGGR